MTERQRELLTGVCLRYHGAVEIAACHALDIAEAVRGGMMEVDDDAVFIHEDWFARLNDADTRGLALAISAGLDEEETDGDLTGTVAARNISSEVM